MAKRSWVSKSVVQADKFLSLPVTAQLLYFNLALEADGNGYVENPNRVARIVSAANGDLVILRLRGYIETRADGSVKIVERGKQGALDG